jgi:hypothetical protein
MHRLPLEVSTASSFGLFLDFSLLEDRLVSAGADIIQHELAIGRAIICVILDGFPS